MIGVGVHIIIYIFMFVFVQVIGFVYDRTGTTVLWVIINVIILLSIH